MVVLCPLMVERRAAARAVGSRAEVRCTGPGEAAIARAVRSLNPAETALVVLFGVSGGLRQMGEAPAISGVIDARTGERWSPTLVAPGPGAVVAGVDEPALTPSAKRAIAERTGASLVDCESHAFARVCASAPIAWAVVRGVSDGPDEALPAQAAHWVDDRGCARVGRVIRDCVRRPALIPAVARLGRRSSRALRAASGRLTALVDHAGATIGVDAAR
ncbi:MAG: hypothetical protein D6693_04105 [Planctomycetota bacterium]|nr:MAG: hypothetical protein D6693_04105 [Planctomycetota bacterium]